jgi:hypothetical protein
MPWRQGVRRSVIKLTPRHCMSKAAARSAPLVARRGGKTHIRAFGDSGIAPDSGHPNDCRGVPEFDPERPAFCNSGIYRTSTYVSNGMVRNHVIEASVWYVRVPRRPYVFTLAGSVLLLLAQAAFAADPPGRYQDVLGESAYLISVPPDWNGGLVIFAHGYEGEGSGKGGVHQDPLDDHLTARGYAWAASG